MKPVNFNVVVVYSKLFFSYMTGERLSPARRILQFEINGDKISGSCVIVICQRFRETGRESAGKCELSAEDLVRSVS